MNGYVFIPFMVDYEEFTPMGCWSSLDDVDEYLSSYRKGDFEPNLLNVHKFHIDAAWDRYPEPCASYSWNYEERRWIKHAPTTETQEGTGTPAGQ